jgi:MFS family permease
MKIDAKQQRWVLTVLLAASALPIMQAVLVAPALSSIYDSFSGAPNTKLLVRVVLVAPTISVIVFAPLMGILADRFERIALLGGGITLYAFSALGASYAHTLEQLIAFRIIMGVSIAAIMTCASLLIGSYFEGRDRDKAFGAQSATIGFSGAIFPVIGGALASANWRYVFGLCAAALLLVPAAMRLPSSKSSAVEKANDKQLFPYGIATLACGLLLLGMVVMYLITIQIAFHLRELDRPSPSLAGLAIGSASLAAAVCSLSYGRLRKKLTLAQIAATSFIAMWLGYLIVGLVSNVALVLTGLMIAGCGFGLNLPNCMTWLLNSAPASLRGRASAALTTAMFAGQFVSPFVYHPLVAQFGSAATFVVTASACFVVAGLLAAGSVAWPSKATQVIGTT